jgi:hypothetical protein
VQSIEISALRNVDKAKESAREQGGGHKLQTPPPLLKSNSLETENPLIRSVLGNEKQCNISKNEQ